MAEGYEKGVVPQSRVATRVGRHARWCSVHSSVMECIKLFLVYPTIPFFISKLGSGQGRKIIKNKYTFLKKESEKEKKSAEKQIRYCRLLNIVKRGY